MCSVSLCVYSLCTCMPGLYKQSTHRVIVHFVQLKMLLRPQWSISIHLLLCSLSKPMSNSPDTSYNFPEEKQWRSKYSQKP